MKISYPCRMGKTTGFVGALALASLSCALPAHAALLVSEDFNYGAGEVIGANGGSGFSAAWVNGVSGTLATEVLAGGLSYTDGVSSVTLGGVGGALEVGRSAISGNNANRVSRSLSATANQTSLFVSLLIQPTGGSFQANDAIFMYLGASAGGAVGLSERVGISANGTDVLGGQLGNGVNVGAAVNTGGATANGTTYLIVMKLEKQLGNTSDPYDKMSLWVNPTLYASTFDTPQASTTITGGLTSLAAIGVGTASAESGDYALLDRFRIGTEVGNVVDLGIELSEIPEPSTWLAYAGAVGMGGLWYRRRRQA